MRRSKRLLENGDSYQREIIIHNNSVMDFNSMNKIKTFIVVAQDVKRYPTPSSIIAVTSSDKKRYWDVPPKPRGSNTPPPMMFEIGEDGEMIPSSSKKKGEERYFDKQVATQEVGLKEPRYFMIVDEVTPRGDVICYDDMDNKHIFKDNVQVVDLFLYPAMKIAHTFQTEYDYNEDLMAIKLGDLATEDEIIAFVDNIHSNKMCHERIVITLSSEQRIHMSNMFTDRGILPNNISRTVRIRLEKCISIDEDLSTGVYDGAKDAIEQFLSWGYNVDIITDKNAVNKKAHAFLEHFEIPYTSINGYVPYEIVIEPKSCFMTDINWNLILNAVYDKAHLSNEPIDSEINHFSDFSETVKSVVDEMGGTMKEVDTKGSDAKVFIVDLENLDDEMKGVLDDSDSTIIEFDDADDVDEHYLFLLYITEEDYKLTRQGSTFDETFPLTPNWDIVKKLQDYFNSDLLKFDDMPLDLQKIVIDLQLEEYFKN